MDIISYTIIAKEKSQPESANPFHTVYFYSNFIELPHAFFQQIL
jgi:hypothetical protein